MKMRFLGKTGIQVSELCLGAVSFDPTGLYAKVGQPSEKEANRIVSMALDAGINFFNTAEIYSDGNAEITLGKALGNRRKDAIIITKVHPTRSPGPNDGGHSRKYIIEGCNASLKRLNTDYIDLYELHAFDPYTPLEVTLRALDDLVREGKVRYIGCSNYAGWQLMKALAISHDYRLARFVTLEAMYSLAIRDLEYELVPLCLDQDIAILAFSPLHMGFLTGKYRRGRPWPAGTRLENIEDLMGPWAFDTEKLFDIVEELYQVAEKYNVTVSQTALNYLLNKPGVNSLIFGARTAEQLEENLKATDWQMIPEDVASLDSISEPKRRYPYFIPDPKKSKE